MKRLKDWIVLNIGPLLGNLIIRFLALTIQIKELNAEVVQTYWRQGKNVIIASWHGRLLMIPFVYKGSKVHILVSLHRDGELISRTLRGFGLFFIRGSTTLGGAKAMRNLVKVVRGGSDIGITPDGPRGPRCKVQAGVVQLAKLTGLPIIPVTFGSSRGKYFNSWDRFFLPYPFSKGVFIWGSPIFVDKGDDVEALNKKRLILEKSLNEITEKADNFFKEG